MSSSPRPIHKYYALTALSILLTYAFILGIQPIYEFDVWWHLKVGEWIVQHRGFFTNDIFSAIHPEREWRTFNWLFEVLIYGIDRVSGLFGLRIFISLVTAAAYGIWFVFFLRETKNYFVSFALLALLMILYAGRIQIRPHIFNFVFEGLLLLFMQSGGILNTTRKRILFFIAAVAWANFHHPFATIGMMLVWIGSTLQIVIAMKQGVSRDKATSKYGWPILLSAIAILCNPYGISLFRAAFANIAPVYSMIGEWKPPLSALHSTFLQGIIAALAPASIFLLCLGVILSKKIRGQLFEHKNLKWLATCCVPLAYLAISQTSLRFVYLACAPLAWILGGLHLHTKYVRRFFIAATIGLLVILVHHQIVVDGGGMRTVIKNIRVDVLPGLFPDVPAQVIRDAHLTGSIGTSDNWGGYLLWFANPQKGVSADTRNNLAPDVFHLQEEIFRSIRFNGVQLLAAINELGTEIVVLPFGAFPFSHWPKKKWIRIAHSPNGEAFLRTDSEDMVRIRSFLGLPKDTTPEEIQIAATQHFGEQYYLSQSAQVSTLRKDQSEEAIHRLAFIESMAGHKDVAIGILSQHIQTVPTCLQGLTEVAGLLHDVGRIRESRQVLEPVMQSPSVPQATYYLWNHLQTHKNF